MQNLMGLAAVVIGLLLFTTGVLLGGEVMTQPDASVADADAPALYSVERVVDGDTIVVDLNGSEETVRLLLIDTPESVHPDNTKNTELGEAAAGYLEDLLRGQTVSLELDAAERDPYGRLLAYVYLADGTFVNALLVQEGYAQLAVFPPNVKYEAEIRGAQQLAMDGEKGLWGTGGMEPELHYVGNLNSRKLHRPDCEAVATMAEKNKVYFETKEAAVAQGYQACMSCKP